MKKFLCIAAVALSFLLSACGFHLRGSEPLPPELNTIYLTSSSPYDSFMQQLRMQLASRHIQVVNSASNNAITLTIHSNSLSNSQTSLSASEQTRSYSVTYTVVYSLNTFSGKEILAPRTVSATQTITLQPNQLIDNTPQLQNAEQQLIPQVITQLFEGLGSMQVKQALSEQQKAAR